MGQISGPCDWRFSGPEDSAQGRIPLRGGRVKASCDQRTPESDGDPTCLSATALGCTLRSICWVKTASWTALYGRSKADQCIRPRPDSSRTKHDPRRAAPRPRLARQPQVHPVAAIQLPALPRPTLTRDCEEHLPQGKPVNRYPPRILRRQQRDQRQNLDGHLRAPVDAAARTAPSRESARLRQTGHPGVAFRIQP